MSKTVNKVILLGNAGKDPEIKSTNGGTLVALLSLATADRFKDKQGEWQDRAEWHNLVAYARSAEILRDYRLPNHTDEERQANSDREGLGYLCGLHNRRRKSQR